VPWFFDAPPPTLGGGGKTGGGKAAGGKADGGKADGDKADGGGGGGGACSPRHHRTVTS
jgi:hypothetical protein